MTPEQWVRVNRGYRAVSMASAAVGLVVVVSFVADGDAEGAALMGAFTLLFFYRLLAGSFFAEGSVHDDRLAHRSRRRSRRRKIVEDVV